MAKKNVTLRMMYEGAIVELFAKTGVQNVVVDDTGKTLATKLAEIEADIQAAVAGGFTAEQAQAVAAQEIAKWVGEAPEAGDTLLELFNLISGNQGAIETINTAITGKVDKVEGKGLSTNDLTNDLLALLQSVSNGANKTEKSDTNGNIKIDGQEVKVYTHPTGAGNEHLPSGGNVGQVLRADGSGKGVWGENVRSGASVPSDLAEGEFFIEILAD